MSMNILMTIYAILTIYFMTINGTPRFVRNIVAVVLGLLIGDLWS